MSTTNNPATVPRPSTILIVDDDEDMLNLCAIKLEINGFPVLKAIGSAEAHRICADRPAKIDLILIDMMLYPPTVHLDNLKNASPRVHGDKLRWVQPVRATPAASIAAGV